MTATTPVVLKLGGELLEAPHDLGRIAGVIAAAAAARPLVVVHGGGREIDAALARAGIVKRQVDGLRITDQATLDVVVPVLAGAINTRLVAAVGVAGGKAVGLTGADAGTGLVEPARPHLAADGTVVPLGLVGQPVVGGPPELLTWLIRGGFIPVVACVGVDRRGQLYNVNADTLAAALAASLGASRLVIAGTTPGVLDASGRTIPLLDPETERALVGRATVTAGMLAKLHAARAALLGGVANVAIADGRDPVCLQTLLAHGPASTPHHGTQVVT